MSEVKLNEKLQKIATEIEGLTTLEMADLAKYLEEKFGVSAMPVAAAPTAGAGAAAPAEEKTSFTVNLTDAGANKLAVIKAVREILPNLGLMDAKKLVESAPKELLKEVKKDVAEEAKKKVEAAGGKVELK
ncbi:50S ribosomal protein L7/L12 [Patescibacteria group bacterium]|nr:50S ribosomal protein L7/L12 [Patescibacteria group bacterium]